MKIPRQASAVHTVTVPFELRTDIGLGDVVKKATSAVGIAPCAPCLRRADWLNRRIVFTGRRSPTPR